VGGGATNAAPLTISNTGLNANGKELIKYPTAPASQNGIVILKKNAEITFSLNNTSNTLCSMAGLAINGLPSNNVGNPDPSGGTNFKVTAWNQTTINLKAIGANANSAWKLFVAVIDGAGNLGIIDPQIENDANIG
jgi:hypothetical protein